MTEQSDELFKFAKCDGCGKQVEETFQRGEKWLCEMCKLEFDGQQRLFQ